MEIECSYQLLMLKFVFIMFSEYARPETGEVAEDMGTNVGSSVLRVEFAIWSNVAVWHHGRVWSGLKKISRNFFCILTTNLKY